MPFVLYKATNVNMDGDDNDGSSVPCEVQVRITYLLYIFLKICFISVFVSRSLFMHTVMYCLWIQHAEVYFFGGGFISSNETTCFPIRSDYFCGSVGQSDSPSIHQYVWKFLILWFSNILLYFYEIWNDNLFMLTNTCIHDKFISKANVSISNKF